MEELHVLALSMCNYCILLLRIKKLPLRIGELLSICGGATADGDEVVYVFYEVVAAGGVEDVVAGGEVVEDAVLLKEVHGLAAG